MNKLINKLFIRKLSHIFHEIILLITLLSLFIYSYQYIEQPYQLVLTSFILIVLMLYRLYQMNNDKNYQFEMYKYMFFISNLYKINCYLVTVMKKIDENFNEEEFLKNHTLNSFYNSEKFLKELVDMYNRNEMYIFNTPNSVENFFRNCESMFYLDNKKHELLGGCKLYNRLITLKNEWDRTNNSVINEDIISDNKTPSCPKNCNNYPCLNNCKYFVENFLKNE